jgi:hypothetical protein
MNYLHEFQRIRSELADRKALLENELSTLPEGELYCYKSHGINCYSERLPAGATSKSETKRGVKRDRDRLFKLVRKQYASKAVHLLEKDINAIDTLLRWYRPTDENSVMESFVEKHPDLVEGIYYGQMSYAEQIAQFKSAGDFHKDALKSTAADGSGRRSLGEMVIGARLELYGIPYRFEAEIGHPDIPYVPDFTIIRPRDGKIIYWEHLGNVNDQEYLNNNKHKFEVYELYGIVPWDNLIISYSQRDYGINEKLIDGLIQGWLL